VSGLEPRDEGIDEREPRDVLTDASRSGAFWQAP
jgi:hypothetical protein